MTVGTFLLCLLINVYVLCLAQCPSGGRNLMRVASTRYYIVQNLTSRGEFVTLDEARKECENFDLKMATVKNMLTMAVLGRELELLAFNKKMKDTWYWLDAKFNNKTSKYIWGDGEEVRYSLFLYRSPRPIGVGSHITYLGAYQKNKDVPQCLTLALPWLGSADHDANSKTYFGHQTTFDERDCKGKSKRHALCESKDITCDFLPRDPFVINEDKQDYFENGNWIFGNRKYIVNWKQRTFEESQIYCQKLGLSLMTAGKTEKFLIPHIKLWSRHVTGAHFWTSMKYNDTSNQFIDSSGHVIANHNINFTEVETGFRGTASKSGQEYCVALSYVYEFKGQMPCINMNSPGCQWSFIRYAPANCRNYHGTICQHSDHEKRSIEWNYPNFTEDLTEALVNTSVTSEFGFKGNEILLRSKYKQTFGNFYCPKGYHMLYTFRGPKPSWALKLKQPGREFYEYDYLESYWVVVEDEVGGYNKIENSNCTISYVDSNDPGNRKFKEVKCTEWHFYLCEKLGRFPLKKLDIDFTSTFPMVWNQQKQPRVYPPTYFSGKID